MSQVDCGFNDSESWIQKYNGGFSTKKGLRFYLHMIFPTIAIESIKKGLYFYVGQKLAASSQKKGLLRKNFKRRVP